MDVYMADKSSSSSSRKKKENSFGITKQKGKFKARYKKRKGKSKCFICGKIDDWKNEYLEFLKKKQGMHHSLLVESCLVVDPKIGIFFIISDQKNS